MSNRDINTEMVNLIKSVCFPETGQKALSHSEIVQMSMEGYPMESAQNMAYDPENVDTSAGRLDMFRMD